MKKYIYKIQNKINGKIYIGQTNNLKRRIQEHKHDKRMHHPIHEAIKKYGFNNFSIEILYYGDDYNAEEKKYIEMYKSNIKKYGYNILNGGQDSSGENNPKSKLSQVNVNNIIIDLKDNKLSLEKIANIYHTTVKTIRNINSGIAWRNNELQYPLRKQKNYILETNEVNRIIDLLRNSDKDIESISKICNVHKYTVLNINKGKTYKKNNETYPIRELGIKRKELDEIVRLLRQENIPIEDIALKFNRNPSQIYRINRGESWYNDSLKYPIRNMTAERNELGQYKCGSLLLMQTEVLQHRTVLFMTIWELK